MESKTTQKETQTSQLFLFQMEIVLVERKIPMTTRIWGRRTRANPRNGLDTHR
jgi:hypothetical protein